MISLKEFMEVVDYRITDGSEFTWSCFGPNASPYTLSAWNNDHDGWSFNVTFDTKTQDVYMVECCDYKHNRAYRLINPDWIQAYKHYVKKHNEDYADVAWDGVDYVDLETDDDWTQKALAIKTGEDYDTRVQVPVDFTDEELLKYMKMAHDRDMTFNQFIEEALRHALDEYRRDPESFNLKSKREIEPHGY